MINLHTISSNKVVYRRLGINHFIPKNDSSTARLPKCTEPWTWPRQTHSLGSSIAYNLLVAHVKVILKSIRMVSMRVILKTSLSPSLLSANTFTTIGLEIMCNKSTNFGRSLTKILRHVGHAIMPNSTGRSSVSMVTHVAFKFNVSGLLAPGSCVWVSKGGGETDHCSWFIPRQKSMGP